MHGTIAGRVRCIFVTLIKTKKWLIRSFDFVAYCRVHDLNPFRGSCSIITTFYHLSLLPLNNSCSGLYHPLVLFQYPVGKYSVETTRLET
jgi:hypothetical protein